MSGNPCSQNKKLKFVKGKIFRNCIENVKHETSSYSFYTYDEMKKLNNVNDSSKPILVRILRTDNPNEIS